MNADDFGRFAESLRDYHASQIAAEAERRLQAVGETNYEKLFGTPERAARTLANLFANCNNGFCYAPEPEDATYDALLELLRGDTE